jgi:hypothetical protein
MTREEFVVATSHRGNWSGTGALAKSSPANSERIDKEERERIRRVAEANKERLLLHDAKDKPAPALTTRLGFSRNKRRAYPREVNLGRSCLGFSSAQSAGEYVIREIMKRQQIEAAQGATIVHVKDGEPITAHGAKLLRVKLPNRASAC